MTNVTYGLTAKRLRSAPCQTLVIEFWITLLYIWLNLSNFCLKLTFLRVDTLFNLLLFLECHKVDIEITTGVYDGHYNVEQLTCSLAMAV